MSALIEQSTGLPVIKLGRMAGQYALNLVAKHLKHKWLQLYPAIERRIINGLDFSVKVESQIRLE